MTALPMKPTPTHIRVHVYNFIHTLEEKWDIRAINLFLELMSTAIRKHQLDRTNAGLPLLRYHIVVDRLRSVTASRQCFPCNPEVIRPMIQPFLDGDWDWRVSPQHYDMAKQGYLHVYAERRLQSAAQDEELQRKRQGAMEGRGVWQEKMRRRGRVESDTLPAEEQYYANMITAVYGGRDAVFEDRVAKAFAVTPPRQDVGIATEHYFLSQLRRHRSATLAKAKGEDANIHHCSIEDVDLISTVRGEGDLRVQTSAGGEWFSLQVKTMNFPGKSTYQVSVTQSYDPRLLIAAVIRHVSTSSSSVRVRRTLGNSPSPLHHHQHQQQLQQRRRGARGRRRRGKSLYVQAATCTPETSSSSTPTPSCSSTRSSSSCPTQCRPPCGDQRAPCWGVRRWSSGRCSSLSPASCSAASPCAPQPTGRTPTTCSSITASVCRSSPSLLAAEALSSARGPRVDMWRTPSVTLTSCWWWSFLPLVVPTPCPLCGSSQ